MLKALETVLLAVNGLGFGIVTAILGAGTEALQYAERRAGDAKKIGEALIRTVFTGEQ